MCRMKILVTVTVCWIVAGLASARGADASSVLRLAERYAKNLKFLTQHSLETTGIEYSLIAKSLHMSHLFSDPAELILWPVPGIELYGPTDDQIKGAEKMGLEFVTIDAMGDGKIVRHLLFKKEFTPEKQIEKTLGEIDAGKVEFGGKVLDIRDGVTIDQISVFVDFRQPDWTSFHVRKTIIDYIYSSEKYRMDSAGEPLDLLRKGTYVNTAIVLSQGE